MPEHRLWAPWRLQYMRGERADEGCIFCLVAEAGAGPDRFVLHRGERCLAMLNASRTTAGT